MAHFHFTTGIAGGYFVFISLQAVLLEVLRHISFKIH
jgi:hypothetical protein